MIRKREPLFVTHKKEIAERYIKERSLTDAKILEYEDCFSLKRCYLVYREVKK